MNNSCFRCVNFADRENSFKVLWTKENPTEWDTGSSLISEASLKENPLGLPLSRITPPFMVRAMQTLYPGSHSHSPFTSHMAVLSHTHSLTFFSRNAKVYSFIISLQRETVFLILQTITLMVPFLHRKQPIVPEPWIDHLWIEMITYIR